MLNKVRTTIKRFKMFKKQDKVLVGVSGGPDSVALIYVLNSLKKELKITLYIAHLNHMLRRSEAERDMEFVKQIAKKLNIPCYCKSVNVVSFRKKGSLEEVSRNTRHKFFRDIARKYSLNKIALGHNRDDQAETVLMRIIRGSGLYGLGAIRPVRLIGELFFVRPLIEILRKDIDSYLKRIKVKACLDASNLDPKFFRNRIRNRLIPFLESDFNKSTRLSLANLSEVISFDYEYLTDVARRQMKRVLISNRGKRLSLDLKKLSKLHISMQRMVLRLCIERILGTTRKFDYRHWREIEDLLLNRIEGSIVDLPKSLSVRKDKDRLRLYTRKY